MHRCRYCVYTYIFVTGMALTFHIMTLEHMFTAIKGISLWSMPSRVVRIDTSDEFHTAMDQENCGDHMMEVDIAALPGDNETKTVL